MLFIAQPYKVPAENIDILTKGWKESINIR